MRHEIGLYGGEDYCIDLRDGEDVGLNPERDIDTVRTTELIPEM